MPGLQGIRAIPFEVIIFSAFEEIIVETFNIGDTVRILPYQVTTMYGYKMEGYGSGQVGKISRLSQDYDWRRAPTHAEVEWLTDNGAEHYSGSYPLGGLEVVAKGDGTFIPGVTLPFSQRELREQRWTAFEAAANAVDWTHEGFSNAASFLAWVYLNQDPRARAQLCAMQRKDGSVNPGKVEKLFGHMGLTIDDWAYACPLDIPNEFLTRLNSNPVRNRQCVNWQEVADQFHRDVK